MQSRAARVTFVIGGVRSGKSEFAAQLARGLSQNPVYLATSRISDEDHRRRVDRHRAERGPEWTTIEEDRLLSRPELDGRVVVVDCLTLWLTNCLLDAGAVDDRALARTLAFAAHELDQALARPAHFILISNEIGQGVHATTELGRRFTDLHGMLNQHAASRADSVVLMVAGLPHSIKGPLPERLEPHESASRARSAPSTSLPRFRIPEADASVRRAAEARQARLTKPAGSLGRLEQLAVELAAWQGEDRPSVRPAAALVFASDHPVTAHGVSAFPAAVTRAMLENFTKGGAAVSVLSRSLGVALSVVDVGVDGLAETELDSGIFFRDPVASAPAGDIRSEDALSHEHYARLLLAGASAVERLSRDTRLLVLGEMGIGNTTPASSVLAALFEGEPEAFVGRGTGIDDAALDRKRGVVRDALRRLGRVRDPHEIVRRVGGREIAALLGAMARGLERRMAILVDGFVVTAAAAALLLLNPEARPGMVFAHRSGECAHGRVLKLLGVSPLLDLQMRLGEGSGALSAFPLLELACALHNEMASFESAGVPGRLDE